MPDSRGPSNAVFSAGGDSYRGLKTYMEFSFLLGRPITLPKRSSPTLNVSTDRPFVHSPNHLRTTVRVRLRHQPRVQIVPASDKQKGRQGITFRSQGITFRSEFAPLLQGRSEPEAGPEESNPARSSALFNISPMVTNRRTSQVVQYCELPPQPRGEARPGFASRRM
jgi:hypothetical protein